MCQPIVNWRVFLPPQAPERSALGVRLMRENIEKLAPSSGTACHLLPEGEGFRSPGFTTVFLG